MMENRELVVAFQYEHHHVASPDAERLQECGCLVAFALYVGKGELAFLPFVVGPEQGGFVGMSGCPFIYHVITEIEVFRHVDVEVLHKVVVRLELCFDKKFLKHDILKR